MIDSLRYSHRTSCPDCGVVVMRERDKHISQSMQLSVLQVCCFASTPSERNME